MSKKEKTPIFQRNFRLSDYLSDCEHKCGYSEVKNGECECYNREMDRYEEKSPC